MSKADVWSKASASSGDSRSAERTRRRRQRYRPSRLGRAPASRRRDQGGRGDAGGRVLREAHAAARLNHRGIVTLYELGAENGCAYLVTELIAGPNLREAAAAGLLSDREVAEIGAEVCAALAHAHAQGVVHRDIKPDNVIVRERRSARILDSGGRAKLADFGIASVASSPTLTETGQVIGTLAYMAPEQAAGLVPTAAADVYCAGAHPL